mgnify:CR=1 FL=1
MTPGCPTCPVQMQEDQTFTRAMEEYKKSSGHRFPTWSEVLAVVRQLGYRKAATPLEVPRGTK